MKRKLFSIAVFCLVASVGYSQSKLTTFIFIRHAEKAIEDSKDPALSTDGMARAIRLAELLSQTKIDAIFTTAYKRTTQTVIPVADPRKLEIQNYDPSRKETIDEIWTRYQGGTVLVVGHSNTVPSMINALTGNEDVRNFEDTDYGNLVIVTVLEKGKNAQVTWLRY